MMNIIVRSEEFDGQFVDRTLKSRPGFGNEAVTFRYRARPCEFGELWRLASDAGVDDISSAWGEPNSTDGKLLRQAVAARCLVEITAALSETGDAVGVNGKPATDPSVLPIVLGYISPTLALHVGELVLTRALKLEVQLGESEPAPV